jgi:hypothetical protein
MKSMVRIDATKDVVINSNAVSCRVPEIRAHSTIYCQRHKPSALMLQLCVGLGVKHSRSWAHARLSWTKLPILHAAWLALTSQMYEPNV